MPMLITHIRMSLAAETEYQTSSKAQSEEFKNPKARLVDMVRLSIAAHGKGHASISWHCWQPCLAAVRIGDVVAA